MGFTLPIELLYAISGFAVGALVGMTGVGGGSLMTPILVLGFGVHPAMAVGTDLLYAAATKSGGTLVHGFYRNVVWRVVARLAMGSVPATALTLALLSQVDIGGAGVRNLIMTMLGVTLMLTAAALLVRRRLIIAYAKRIGTLGTRRTRNWTIATGATLGVLVSISSVGGGALGVTALILLYPRLPLARIVGSDIAHAVPLTFLAGLGHWLLGTVDWQIFGMLLVGSLPGIVAGSVLASWVPDFVLRFSLAGALIAAACNLVF